MYTDNYQEYSSPMAGEFQVEHALDVLPHSNVLVGAAPLRNPNMFASVAPPPTETPKENPYAKENYYATAPGTYEYMHEGSDVAGDESEELLDEGEEGNEMQSDEPLADNMVDNAEHLETLEELESVRDAYRELENAHASHKEGVRRAAVIQVKRLRNLRTECKELASHARSHMKVRIVKTHTCIPYVLILCILHTRHVYSSQYIMALTNAVYTTHTKFSCIYLFYSPPHFPSSLLFRCAPRTSNLSASA
jgi:hypothetical protein